MKLAIEKATAQSRTAKKPLATLKDEEKAGYSSLCTTLSGLRAAHAEADAESARRRDLRTTAGAAITAGDAEAIKTLSEEQATAEQFDAYRSQLISNLDGARRSAWSQALSSWLLPVLKRAEAEAEKRIAKIEKDKLAEGEALSESGVVESAARRFWSTRLQSLRTDLRTPEKRFGASDCAKTRLADPLIDTGEE